MSPHELCRNLQSAFRSRRGGKFCCCFRGGRMSAGEIAGHFEMTGATVSYHLSVLKKADLVFETREKNFIYYELNTSVVEEVMLWLSQLKGDNHESHS